MINYLNQNILLTSNLIEIYISFSLFADRIITFFKKKSYIMRLQDFKI